MLNRIKSIKLHKKIFLAYSLVFLVVMILIFVVLWRQISNTYRKEIQHEASNVHSQVKNSYERLKSEIQGVLKELTEDYRVLTAIQSGTIGMFPESDFLDFLEYGNSDRLIVESTYQSRRGILDRDALSTIQNDKSQLRVRNIGENKFFLQMTMPIEVNERLYGFVTGGIRLRKQLTEILPSSSERLYLLRIEKRIYSLNEKDSLQIELSDSERELKYRGNKYSISRIPLAESSELIVAFSQKRLIQQQNRLVYSLVFIGLVGIVAMYLAGYLTARQITRPIDRLTEGAVALSKGDLEHRISFDSHDEVGLLAEQFNQMAAELKTQQQKRLAAERIAAWRDVARMVAHEIKNPLFPIQLSIETLHKSYYSKPEMFDEIFDESVETVMNELDRLREIIEEFHQFAKMPQPKPEACNVNAVLKDTLNLYSKTSENIEIVTELEELPEVLIDQEQFSRVFQNLIKNAIEAMPKGGKLTISSRYISSKGKVEISFEDTGIGMDEKTRKRIFEPYFTTKKDGTGLGMALVQRVILEHQGNIEIESEKDKGTKIVIEISDKLHY